jgi:hypothetical protein
MPALSRNGERCAADGDCGSGHCVLNICCVTTCDKAAPESCGLTGACQDDGAACQKYGKDTRCSPESCSASGGGVYTAPKFCDGQGKCPTEVVTMPCMGAPCEGNRCQMGCGPGKPCVPGNFCKDGSCAAQKAGGESCSTADECSSGFCTDGVCCDKACKGACEACSKGKNDKEDGRCLPVKSGADPDDECSETDKTKCGNDGFCDGKGACRKYDSSTSCKAPSCGAGFSLGEGKCDGKGTCRDGAKTSCQGGLRCVGDRCLTTCTSESSCQKSGEVCASNGSSCVAPAGPGESCNGKTCKGTLKCARNGLCCDDASCDGRLTCAKTDGHCGEPKGPSSCVLSGNNGEGKDGDIERSDVCASRKCQLHAGTCTLPGGSCSGPRMPCDPNSTDMSITFCPGSNDCL